MFRKIFKISLLISIFGLISKGLGLYREHLLSKTFGGISENTNLLDSYYIAFRIPDFLYNIILLGVGIAVLVPLYIKLQNKKDELNETFWTINIFASLTISILCIIIYFLLPYILPLIFFSYNPQIINEAINLSKIMILSPIFFTLSSLIGAYLQSYHIYIYSYLSPVIYNIGIIFGIIYLYPKFGTLGLAYGVILGSLFHFLIQTPLFLKIKIPQFKLGKLGFSNFKYCLKQTIPRGLTLATSQLNLFIDSILSGFLISGSLSLYMWTQNIFYLPLGFISISLSIPALTHFSEIYHSGNINILKNTFSKIITHLFVISIFLSIWLIFTKEDIINILFDYGKFSNSKDTNLNLMSTSLLILGLSLPFHSLIPIFTRFSHAKEDMITPLKSTLISVIINFAINYYLIIFKGFNITGLAIGFGTSGIIQCLYFIFIYKKYLNLPNLKEIFSYLILFTANIFILKSIYTLTITSLFSLGLSTLLLGIFSSIYLFYHKRFKPI